MPDNKRENPKPKKTYLIHVEEIVQMTAQYRVLAEDEDEAIERFKLGYAQLESRQSGKPTRKKILVRLYNSLFSKPYPPF